MAERIKIESCLRELLRPEEFNDYGPNDLRVARRRPAACSPLGARAQTARLAERPALRPPLLEFQDPA